jgi:hypothetical protein
MKRPVVFALLAVAMITAHAHADGFYQWTDSDGRQFYTNEKSKIPAQYRDSATPVEVHEDRVSVGQKAAEKPAAVRESEHKDRNGRGESYWRKRAENLRRQIREQQDQHDLLVKQGRDEEERNASHPSKSTEKARAAREKKMRSIEKRIASLQRELDVQLPEEARKADAYPAWVRE